MLLILVSFNKIKIIYTNLNEKLNEYLNFFVKSKNFIYFFINNKKEEEEGWGK